ncbi:LysR family transcriptional regulator [Crenobacter sp. SG2303]|uniref:LysR family transcriptional regulator n=1 Tax=Crenobacter oryzisoli TaxID=3056844 RepID=A0ABT7XQG2_9NEIS|nr:LysR family transcriptional regulator [Crenobacter sp. SG2303]MDN0076039.1 LysR family transcriptional regulator [Crenobacter sp. SG2303]
MQQSLMWEIRVFCAVVDKHSFVAAARMLGRSPSTISRAIQALEAVIGSELLHRSHKVVSLTAAGESYYGYAKQLLALQEEAEEELAGLGSASQGWIRFAAPESMALGVLPALLNDFGQAYPDLRIDVHFTDETLDPIQEKLDFVIRGAFPQSSELIGLPLWNYRRHLYASPEYLQRRGIPQQPEELVGHDLIIHTSPRILKDWHFASGETQTRLKVEPRYRFSSGVAVYQAVRQGVGIARLGDWLGEPAVREGALVRLCPAYRLTSSTGQDPQMHAVYASGRQPGRVRAFLTALRAAGQTINTSTL